MRSPAFFATALACAGLPALSSAQTTATTPTTTPPPPSGTPTVAPRAQPFATFDNASAPVRDAVASATASAQIAVASLEEAIRLGVVSPATTTGAATPALPPSVAALPAAVTRANNVILADSRATRAPALTPREAAVARLRQAQTEPERLRAIEELRASSSQRLEAQREDARLVRDRLRQLRDLTTVTRPSGT